MRPRLPLLPDRRDLPWILAAAAAAALLTWLLAPSLRAPSASGEVVAESGALAADGAPAPAAPAPAAPAAPAVLRSHPHGSVALRPAPLGVSGAPRDGSAGIGAPRGTREGPVPKFDFLPRTRSLLSPEARAELEAMLQEERDARIALPRAQARNRHLRERLEAAGLTPEPSLDELAERGEVRFTLADTLIGDEPLSPEAVAELGLDAGQVASVEAAYQASGDALAGELRGIHADLTGDAEGGAGLTLGALIEAIRDATPPEDWEAAVRAAARRQAGVPDEGAGTPADRLLSALIEQRERLREQLVEALGEELADRVLAQAGVYHSIGVGARRE